MSQKTSPGFASSAKVTKLLLDRCLAPSLADTIRKTGIPCTTLAEVYGKVEAQSVEDVEWIQWAAKNGYAVLTANPRILQVVYERDAILSHGTKVFCIANPQLTKEGRAYIFGRHVLSILRRMQQTGPCFWRLNLGSPIRYDI